MDPAGKSFVGRHYETGTITNALVAAGYVNPTTKQPYSEALVFGASGGVAFGYFTFEYRGDLPHVSLLTRNTFSPFERALDNLGIRRVVKETAQAQMADFALREQLDLGNTPIVFADVFSMPYRALPDCGMWAMRPLVVLGYQGDQFTVADGSLAPVEIDAGSFLAARGKVKKDRFRMVILERPEPALLAEGLLSGLRTCVKLALGKPPAGSKDNFGIQGMRYFAKMLKDTSNPKSFGKKFEPGPRLAQALIGRHGQPGIWDWVQTWGTNDGGDRSTFAAFLREAAVWTDRARLLAVADLFDQSYLHWVRLAECSLPDSVSALREIKRQKTQLARLWFDKGVVGNSEREVLRTQIRELTSQVLESDTLSPLAGAIQEAIAEETLLIADIEEAAFIELRSIVAS